jgi:hypothetical protein
MTSSPLPPHRLLLILCVLAALQAEARAGAVQNAAVAARDFSGAWSTSAQGSGATPLASTAERCAQAGAVPGIGSTGVTHIVTGRSVMVVVPEGSQQLRHIYLNAEQPKGLLPSALGHSVGQFEGDTLVVETIGLPAGMTLVERFRKVDDGRQLERTADGNATLARRDSAAVFAETVCEQAEVGTVETGTAATVTPPSFEGVWQIERPVTILKAADGQVAPLKPAAKVLYRQRVLQYRAGDARSFDHSLDCQPVGEPRASQEGQPFEIVQGNDTIFIGYSQQRMMRFVYLGDQVHPPQPGSYPPAYMGQWTGHWEGESLVLEGHGFRPDTLLDAAGLPHSGELRIVQRLSLQKGGATLLVQSSYDDPRSFKQEWSSQQRYRRLPAAAVSQLPCRRQEQHDG